MAAPKKFLEFCGHSREVPERSPIETSWLLTPRPCSGFFLLISRFACGGPTRLEPSNKARDDLFPNLGRIVRPHRNDIVRFCLAPTHDAGWAFQTEFRDFARKRPTR